MIFSSHVLISKQIFSAKHMSYRETICFASIPARARSGEQCCKAAAALNAPSRSVSSPVYSLVFFCRMSAQRRTCSSNTALTSFCVMWHPSFEKMDLSRILYKIRDSFYFTHSADKSSRALGTRSVRPPWGPAGRYIPRTPSVCPQTPCHTPYKSGIPGWK